MHRRILFLFFQYLIFCTRYDSSNAKALIGFNIRHAEENEFSCTVSVINLKRKRSLSESHICTGVLVSRKHVLSAEHCMCKDVTKCTLLVGSNNLNKCTSYKLKSWISYNQWTEQRGITSPYKENDVSVITLEDNVNDLNIIPATLSNRPSNKLYGTKVMTAGWGQTNNGVTTEIMETVVLDVISRKDCNKRINNCARVKTTVPESLICTVASPFALIGCGESGGPLFDMNYVLVGVNIATCPETDLEINEQEVNIHVSIHYYREFIDDIISRN